MTLIYGNEHRFSGITSGSVLFCPPTEDTRLCGELSGHESMASPKLAQSMFVARA